MRPRVFRPDGGEAPWEVGTGGNLLLRRAIFDRVGGFDEEFGPGARFRAAEDVELLERLLHAGATLAYTPRAVVHHEMKTRSDRLLGLLDLVVQLRHVLGLPFKGTSGAGTSRRFPLCPRPVRSIQ